MTLPFSDRVTSTYTTDGVLKEFNFDFRVFFNVDSGSYGLEVRRIIEGGYEVISPSLYTVIPNEGMISGKIVFSLAPESGQEIYISGKTPTVQQLNLTNYGRYNAEALETNFDFIVAICQEFISKIDEETRQRINADEVLKNNLNAIFESLATDIDARFNGKWTEIADYLNRTLPMFFCIMRKEINAYAQTGLIDVINSELDKRGLSELIDEYINSLDDSFLSNTKYFSGAFEFDPDFVASGGKYPLNAQLRLTNGAIVKSTVPNNTANPNVDMTGWERTGLYAPFEVMWKGLNRKFYEHAKDYVNVLDYGALNDGVHHTIQEWVDSGKFSSLSEIQTVFPKATSLSDCVNTTVFQYLVDLKKIGYAPKGTYAFIKGKSIHTPHSGSPNRIDSGGGFFGDGCLTIFTQLSPSTPSTDEDTRNNEAIISLHGSYTLLKDITFNSGCIGVYLGQDLTKSESSSVYLNSFENLQFRNMGRGISFEASGGNHYNKFDNIHFIQCQVDCRMRNSSRSVTIANNNRNRFSNIRSNRSIVGLWCSAGDTNRFDRWDGEGCGVTPNSNPFNGQVIAGLPAGITTCVHIFDGNGQLNKVSNSQMEECEVELYSSNYANTFMLNGYHENVENGTQVYIPTEPKLFISAHTFYTDGYKFLSNVNLNAFPNHPYAGRPTLQGTRVQLFSPTVEHRGLVTENGVTRVTTSYHLSSIFELGAVAASSTVQLVLWDDVDPSSAATIDIEVIGLAMSNTLSFSNKFFVSAYRSSAKALSRYFMKNLVSLRASGQGSGDESTVITGVLSHGGTTSRQLILTLTVPAYAFNNISVYAKRIVTRV